MDDQNQTPLVNPTPDEAPAQDASVPTQPSMDSSVVQPTESVDADQAAAPVEPADPAMPAEEPTAPEAPAPSVEPAANPEDPTAPPAAPAM